MRAKGFFWSVEQTGDLGFPSLAGGTVHFKYPSQWVATLVAKGVLREAEVPASVSKIWIPPFGDRRQEIVFISIHLDIARLEAQLDACLQPEDTPSPGS